MKTRNLTPKLLAAAAAGSLFLAGCLRDESPNDEGSGDGTTVLVEGRLQGDAVLRKTAAGAGVEGALVTVARLDADGSAEVVSTLEAKTDAQGRFSVPVAADGARELVVRARQAGKEWKAVVAAKAEQGKTVACRPLDMESTLEADLLAQARGSQGAATVSFVDIAAAIDAEIAAQAEAGPEGKAAFEAYVSAQLRTGAEARAAALIHGTAKATQAQIEKAEEARLEAEAELEADLDAAPELSAEARARIDAQFRKAEHKAWLDAGLTLEAATAARESCYQAMVKAGAQASVDAGAKALWLRKIALGHAAQIEMAVAENVQDKGGTAIQAGAAAAAGAALEASIRAAGDEAGIDSAFQRFRSDCASLEIGIPGITAATPAPSAGFALSGKVEGGASGADVQAARVNADGSLEIVDGAKGTTDAQGGFILTSQSRLPDSLVVIVTQPDRKLMVYVDGSTPAPVQVGSESTVEARIVQQLAKDGLGGTVSVAEVKAGVDSGLAAELQGNDSAIARFSAGLESAARAKGSLSVTSGMQARDSAVSEARASELYAQALARFTGDLSAGAGFRLVKAAQVSASASLRIAAEGAAESAGAADAAIGALAAAGDSMQASIEAAADAEAIDSAYAGYHAAVIACLKPALLLQASALEKADAAIRGRDGARAVLMAKLAAAADPESAAQAQVEFAAQVEVEARAAFGTGLGAPSEAQLHAIVDALVLANMGG